jgi:UDP-N-acetylglucosamine acyltransferase
VSIGDSVFLGGQAAVHQFTRIGEGAMIGGLSGVRGDVIPFGYAVGQLADLAGLNVVGLKRLGHSRSEMHRLRQAYRMLFGGAGPFAQRAEQLASAFAGDVLVDKVVAFILSDAKRPLTQPGRRRRSEPTADHDGA